MKIASFLRCVSIVGLFAMPCAYALNAPAVSYDFNGDGTSDVLWQQGSAGELYIWQISLGQISATGGGSPGQPSANWSVFGSGDFNGDGKADILWRDFITGQVYVWFMNGAVQNGGNAVGSPPTSDWVIQGVADFNGDGISDILWRNVNSGQVAIWLLAGSPTTPTTLAGSAAIPATPSSDWMIQGTGDFDHDGNADILWRNSNTGQVAIWFMNGTTMLPSSAVVASTPALNWVIQGVGDFSHDGFADSILWSNTTTGQVAIWQMTGAVMSSSTVLASNPGIYWTIQGVGDYNGDGFADILWRNNNTGEVSIWLTNGTPIVSTTTPATPTSDWMIIEPTNSICPDSWSCEALAEHNNVRASGPFGPGNPTPNPAIPPLRYSLSIQNLAKTWVATCPNDDPNTQSGPYAGFGSNYYEEGFSPRPQPPPPWGGHAVDDWSSEAANYNYVTGACSQGECGHYTQVVWRNTEFVGCAVQYCPVPGEFPDTYVVDCLYSPPGNFNNQQPY
jgi:hypothetical protein